jgi:hypothetical protein
MGAFLTVGTGASILKMLGDAGEVKDMATGKAGDVFSEFVEADGAMGYFVEIFVVGGCLSLHEI